VKRNLQSLIQKLAIEVIAEEDTRKRQGRTYRVYSFRRILERRREAGLTRVVLSGHAVKLSVDQRSGDGTSMDGSSTMGVATPSSLDAPSIPSLDVPSTPIESIKEIEKKPSSSELSVFQEKAGQLIGLDDDAARAIIQQCRKQNPEATIDEIWHFCEQKILERIAAKHPVAAGLLITAVPKYFAPPASELNRYRAERRLRGL
jgi:hypothetical protein